MARFQKTQYKNYNGAGTLYNDESLNGLEWRACMFLILRMNTHMIATALNRLRLFGFPFLYVS